MSRCSRRSGASLGASQHREVAVGVEETGPHTYELGTNK